MRYFLAFLSIILLSACQTSPHYVSDETGGISKGAYKVFTDRSRTNGYADYRAFFYSKSKDAYGYSYGFYSVEDAIDRAQKECAVQSDDCQIFAVGDTIVYEKGQDFLRTAMSQYSDSVKPELITDGELGEKVTLEEIEAKFSGMVINGETFRGRKYLASLHKNHGLDVELYGPGQKTNPTDKGRWWTKNNSYCHKLNSFFTAEEDCFSVYRQGDHFLLVNSKNEVFSKFTVLGVIGDTLLMRKATLSKVQKYNMGYMLSYSEVCAQFRGIRLGNLTALDIKQTFETDADFKRGYARFENFTGHDGVIGFKRCDEFNDRLIKMQKWLKS